MSSTIIGLVDWKGSRNKKGHREYEAKWLVETSSVFDGPVVASHALSLPQVGDYWTLGNDLDMYAICNPDMKVECCYPGEIGNHFFVTQKWSTEPLNNTNDNPDNPLTWLPDVSGSFVRFSREAVEDKDGDPLLSTSKERFRGGAVERDFSRHQVSIKMYLATLPLGTFLGMIDHVNSSEMWGLDPKMVKLSNVSWKTKYYGSSYSSKYYEVTYDFDINFETFAFRVLNEGTKILKPGGDVDNPADYIPYVIKGQPATALLKSDGTALASGDLPEYLSFDVYKESNLLSLGIPISL